MPQVITGFDKYAAKVRQAEQDKRTAALQDAQEQRAVSTFEMAKQDRADKKAADAVKAGQDAVKAKRDEEKATLEIQKARQIGFAGELELASQLTTPTPAMAFPSLLYGVPSQTAEELKDKFVVVQRDAKGQPTRVSWFDSEAADGEPLYSYGFTGPIDDIGKSGTGINEVGLTVGEDGKLYYNFFEKGTKKVTSVELEGQKPLSSVQKPLTEQQNAARAKAEWSGFASKTLLGMLPEGASREDGFSLDTPLKAAVSITRGRDAAKADYEAALKLQREDAPVLNAILGQYEEALKELDKFDATGASEQPVATSPTDVITAPSGYRSPVRPR